MHSDVPPLLVLATFTVSPLLLSGTVQAENLLVNGSFAEQDERLPANWSIRKNQQEVAVDAAEAHHPELDQALRVDILCDGGSSYGEIAQAVSVQPNTIYRFQGDWRSSKGQTAFFQIKLIKDRKELQRIHPGWSNPAWQRVVRHVNSGEVSKTDTIEGTIGDAKTDPQLTAPTPEWQGGDDSFNSRQFPDRGARF